MKTLQLKEVFCIDSETTLQDTRTLQDSKTDFSTYRRLSCDISFVSSFVGELLVSRLKEATALELDGFALSN